MINIHTAEVVVLDVAVTMIPLLQGYRTDTACPTETVEVTEVHSLSASSQTVQQQQQQPCYRQHGLLTASETRHNRNRT